MSANTPTGKPTQEFSSDSPQLPASPLHWVLPNLLDRYIFKQLLDYFMLGVVIFSLVAFFSDTLFDFINDIQKYGIGVTTLLTVIGLQLPRSISFVIPASCFLAVLIVYNQLNNNFELIAVRMNGISLSRLVRPALLLGILSTVLTYLINDYVVPYCNKQTEALKHAAMETGNLPTGGKSFLFKAYDNEHNLSQMIYVGNFKGARLGDSTIIDLTNPRTMKIIQAKSGSYDPKSGWLFDNANIYLVSIQANSLSAGHSNTFHIRQLISSQQDLQQDEEKLARRKAEGVLLDSDVQNFWQIREVIAKREALAKERNNESLEPSRKSYLSMWEKLSLPLSSTVIILSAVAMAIQHPRQGSQRGFIIALLVLFLYYILRSFSIAMGHSDWFEVGGLLSKQTGLFLAAWMPLVLMTLVGIGLLCRKSQTL